MTTLRCGDCGYWTGESREPMAFIEVVDRSDKTRVSPPRDLRVCKSCGRVNVYVARSDLDRRHRDAIGYAS